jgi:serine/threonine protein kinase
MKKVASWWRMLDYDAHFIPLSSLEFVENNAVFLYKSPHATLDQLDAVLNKETKLQILFDVACALQYLHESGLVFLNLSLLTVGVYKGSFYLTDCSHMKKIGSRSTFDVTIPFEKYVFFHPDLICALETFYVVEPKHDIWALAMLAYYLFAEEKCIVSVGKKLELLAFYKKHQPVSPSFLIDRIKDPSVARIFSSAGTLSPLQKEN